MGETLSLGLLLLLLLFIGPPGAPVGVLLRGPGGAPFVLGGGACWVGGGPAGACDMDARGNREFTLLPEVLLLASGVDPADPGDPEAVTLSLGPCFAPRFLGSPGLGPDPSTDPFLSPWILLSVGAGFLSAGLPCWWSVGYLIFAVSRT